MKSGQSNYANNANNYVKDPPLQITLRVMHEVFTNPRFWIGFVAIVAIITAAGPFNTLDSLSFAPRLVYWAGISLITFPLGIMCSVFFGAYCFQRNTPEWLPRIIGGIAGGAPIALFVWGVNNYILQNNMEETWSLGKLVGYTTLISMAVSIVYFLIESNNRPDSTDESDTASPATPIFLKRLPVELGKDLISLQAQDHYIKATTVRGSEMVLLRLSDAQSELETIQGIQVHRSWWVARSHAKRLYRENSKLVLELSNGEIVPVSRSYSKQVRQLFENA